MGDRRKSREITLQALYMFETVQKSSEDLVSLSWITEEVHEEVREFAEALIGFTIDNIEKIDGLINKHSKNWSFERLTAVDKSILRMCISEMLHFEDIPMAVTINEGIELGKIFGGESSGQFINGLLDAIKKEEIHRNDQHR